MAVLEPSAALPANKVDAAIQALGWVGAFALLLAYYLTSVVGLPIDGPVSLILNMGAGLSIALASWRRKAYPSVFTNVVWFMIGFVTLIKVLFR